MRYFTGTANYAMQNSEYRSRQASNLFHIPFTKSSDDKYAEKEAQRLAPIRDSFQRWLDSLPPTVSNLG